MSALDTAYEQVRSSWSDISDQIPLFESLVADMNAQQVIELGVRWASSTVVWLHALHETGGELWSVDVNWPSGPYVGALDGNVRWTFLHGDDLHPAVLGALPAAVDLVFIDTSHGYQQTTSELDAYAPRVRPGGAILLHDTNLRRPETAPAEDPDYPVGVAALDWTAAHDSGVTFLQDGYGLGVISC